MTEKEPYRIKFNRAAARQLAKILPEKIATAAYEFIAGALKANPRRLGKPPGSPLAPAWSARRGEYRILHLIHEDQRLVEVTAIRYRGDAYRLV